MALGKRDYRAIAGRTQTIRPFLHTPSNNAPVHKMMKLPDAQNSLLIQLQICAMVFDIAYSSNMNMVNAIEIDVISDI